MSLVQQIYIIVAAYGQKGATSSDIRKHLNNFRPKEIGIILTLLESNKCQNKVRKVSVNVGKVHGFRFYVTNPPKCLVKDIENFRAMTGLTADEEHDQNLIATPAEEGTKTTVSSTAPIAASTEPSKPVMSETIAGTTEEERIKAMFETSNEQWQQQSTALALSQSQKGLAYRPQYNRPAPPVSSPAGSAPAAVSVPNIPIRGVTGPAPSTIPIRPSAGGAAPQQQSSFLNNQQSRPPPISYVCYKCGIGGHWIQFCPTGSASGGVRPENVVVKKKTTQGLRLQRHRTHI